MPRFYFDLMDDRDVVDLTDAEGCDFLDAEAAREEAIGALPEIGKSVMREGSRCIKIAVRNEAGRRVFEAKLRLDEKWIDAGDQ